MAFFKFRTADGPGAPRQPESIETMRRRARHRLIGATVLVLAGVVGFPLLFDTQPRPIPVDIPIEIPDRNKARPLPVPSRAPAAPTASGRVSVPPAPPAPAAVAPEPQRAAEAPAPKAEPAPPAKQDAAPRSKVEVKPDARAAAADERSKAKALPQGTGGKDAAPADGRFVVQVGAFADPAKAREARARVERAGLKTYTHVADTKDGKRIRVRVGPFPTRAEADRAASKIKGLDMPAAILTL